MQKSELEKKLKKELKSFFIGRKVKSDEIIAVIEENLTNEGLSFEDVTDFSVKEEPEIMLFGYGWFYPSDEAWITLFNEDERRLFLLKISHSHNYDWRELEFSFS